MNREEPDMQTARRADTRPATCRETLSRCALVVDGNSHRPDLSNPCLPQNFGPVAAESMLPAVRTVAQMIAASRHRFDRQSPRVFTDEADWFAARIIIFRARRFHLNLNLHFMLETANRRAEAFAKTHRLPFTPAKLRISLYADRPNNLLMMDCALDLDGSDLGLIENSRRLAGLIRQPFA
uniref:Uncharacterized protein n=2 Tax=Neisseria leonii TaxID=2995413 RepID=A0A9X4IDI8_9NEIS|nr:hypothetical protein [Neisseria sp. 51.81]MDD9327178.1 hypothetical protein [Neisseria sp. 51.81]